MPIILLTNKTIAYLAECFGKMMGMGRLMAVHLFLLSLHHVASTAQPTETKCALFEVQNVGKSTQRLVVANCTEPVNDTDFTALVHANPDITEVWITNAKLTKIPTSVCNISAMTTLKLTHNLLIEFQQPCLSALTGLKHLDLSHNALSQLRGEDLMGLNHLETLSLHDNEITFVYYDAWVAFNNTTSLHGIYLNHNLIRTLPDDVGNLQLHHVRELDLSYNYFLCNCTDYWIKPWLEGEGEKIINKFEIMCRNSKMNGAFPMLKITDPDKFTCDDGHDSHYGDPKLNAELTTMILAFIIVVMTLPMIIGLVCCTIHAKRRMIFARTKWHPFDLDNCAREEKEYDVFISCAHQDEDWCTEKVKSYLEDRQYKVCWHREHFRPGEPILNSVGRCIESSKRTLCILTSNFVASPMCMREMEVAIAADFEKNQHRTIIIKFPDVDIAKLDAHVRRYLRTTTYIEQRSKRFYENLLYALPTNTIEGLLREYDVVVPHDIPLV